MSLTTPERIEIVERSGGRSAWVIAAEFNARHPERENISHVAVFKLLKKFHETGSVHDKDLPGRPRTATAEDMATAVVATVVKSPKRSSRRVASLTGISQRSVLRVLHVNKWHPYKLQLQHRLTEDDPDRRVQFAEWASERCHDDPMFPQRILFSDEALFFVHGEVNKQNHRYWSDTNPNWRHDCKGMEGVKMMVWCGIWGTRIIGPYFIHGTLTGERYRVMLEEDVFPDLLNPDSDFPSFFQQDGAPPHYALCAHQWLDTQFPGCWIGRRGPD